MNLLFVCNQGMHRSRTAAETFKEDHDTRFKGIYSNIVSSADISWADVVFVMEEHQRKTLGDRFPKEYLMRRVLCLDVPDIFRFGQDELVKELRVKINEAIEDIDVPHPLES